MIAVIVLAAGQSTRMGAHKLLLPVGDRAVVAHVVDAAIASHLRPVVVVLGHGADSVREALSGREAEYVVNDRYTAGLSTSLHAGLQALPAAASGAIVAQGDQPGISAALLDALADCAAETSASIVAPTYAGRRGSPVYFAHSLFDELLAVRADSGGRDVIARHLALVQTLPIADAHAGDDIDTPEDYKRLLARWPHDTESAS